MCVCVCVAGWVRGEDEVGGASGDSPIHGEFHLLFVVGDWGVDLLQLQAEFRVDVPA